MRGGSWGAMPWGCRSASRYAQPPEGSGVSLGFRVICIDTHPG
jgi:formylglycine-generating enzyme required for sulfatase activity